MRRVASFFRPPPLPRAGAGGVDREGSVILYAAETVEAEAAGAARLEALVARSSTTADDSAAARGSAPTVVPFGQRGRLGVRAAPWTRRDDSVPANSAVRAVVLDARAVASVGGLGGLLHGKGQEAVRLMKKARGGRLLVLGSATDGGGGVGAAVVAEACEGFVRAVAKEVGPAGAATANLVVSAAANAASVDGAVEYLLSGRAGFVTGQRIDIDDGRATTSSATADVHRLDTKRAVVTGGARGIGASTAESLLAAGVDSLLLVDHPSQAGQLEATAAELAARYDAPVAHLAVDVTDADAGRAIAAAAPRIDVLVHSAGITRDRMLSRMPAESWDAVMAVNLEAVMQIDSNLMDGPAPALAPGARVVCLSSTSGVAGNAGQTNYAASKAGLLAYVKGRSSTARAGVGAGGSEGSERGVVWNAVAPGYIESDMTKDLPFATRFVAGRLLTPLGAPGAVEDVAAAITFLASPAAEGIAGRCLRVCGGMFFGR